MPGCSIIASDSDTGHRDKSAEPLVAVHDDMVIWVTCDEAGSRIDVRSTSRQGHSDYGVNAAGIRAHVGALRKRIG
jgi:uncharacterized protein (DUF1499 family)